MKYVIAKSIDEKILDFLTDNPNPSDDKVHAWAEKHGIEHDKLEEKIYSIISGLLSGGKSKGKKLKVNPKELKAGMKVEKEHTNNPFLTRKIASDHLIELKDYYTRLKKMEKEAEVKKSRTPGAKDIQPRKRRLEVGEVVHRNLPLKEHPWRHGMVTASLPHSDPGRSKFKVKWPDGSHEWHSANKLELAD